MMKAIGGYFELADYEEGIFPHKDGVLLNTGRNALEYILRNIEEVRNVYLPYYTCEVVLEPLKKLHIPWQYYHINTCLEIAEELHPHDGEYIIANNYFGIKDAYIQTLANKYRGHLIVDCAQAFFSIPISGINVFYSTRKYVGVADGGVAYLEDMHNEIVQVLETDCSDGHDSHLLMRKRLGAEAGFADFQENEEKLANQPIRWMSDISVDILSHIDYDAVISKRKSNYSYLHGRLKDKNLLPLPEMDTFVCPMVYPFMTDTRGDMRSFLIDNKVFVAKYWPNVIPFLDFGIEYQLANRLLAIPCDHRYTIDDMNRIVELVFSYLEN